MNSIRTRGDKALSAAAHIVMIALALFAILPFLLLIGSSLTAQEDILKTGYNFFPKNVSFDAYRYLFREWRQILNAYLVTIFVTVLGTVVSLILVSMTSYALSVDGLPGGKIIFVAILFTMLFNGGIVASYVIYSKIFKIKDTIFALLVPNLLLNGFNVVLVRNYIKNSIPRELVEAAEIDGAGLFRTYTSIILPLSKPILATVGLLTALGYWNDWTNGLYYVSDSKLYSIQLLLNQINNASSYLASHSELSIAAEQIPSASVRMAIAVLVILPIMVAYPFFQKHFIKGITNGAVKG